MSMRSLFLGKPVHWLMLIIVAAILWAAGQFHLHVVHFNAFVVVVALLSLATVALVVLRHRPGDAVMRDPLD